MGDQRANMHIERAHVLQRRTGGGDLGADLMQLTLEILVEGAVGGIVGILVLLLQLFLVGKMPVHIFFQKIKGSHQSAAAFAYTASIHEAVDCGKQLPVLGINDTIAGFQFFGQFIFHSICLLSAEKLPISVVFLRRMSTINAQKIFNAGVHYPHPRARR